MKCTKPNIIFILIDALRAQNVGCYGYPLNTTPNIDKIAEKGILFENAFSCINTTDPSITSIFTGHLPISHGLINHGSKVRIEETKNLKYLPWLPKILRENGYKTIAIDWLGRWHRRGFDIYTGFDWFYYYDMKPKETKNSFLNKIEKSFVKRMKYKLSPSLYKFTKDFYNIFARKKERKIDEIDDAKKITNKAINLLEKNKNKSFFTFLHYWDVHWPYNAPKEYFSSNKCYHENYDINKAKKILKDNKKMDLKSKEIEQMGGLIDVIRRYDNSIRYVDEEIGRLFNYLEEHKMFDNTMIIITSDHGESLVEHGIIFEHHGLYDVNIKVPLIIYHPNIPKSRIKSLVQHIDILPTIKDLLDTNKKSYTDGKSLLPLVKSKINKIRDYIIFEEAHTQRKAGLRTLNSKYIRDFSDGTGKCRYCGIQHGDIKEFYNLNNDLEETNNIIQKDNNVTYNFDILLKRKRKKLKGNKLLIKAKKIKNKRK